MRKSSFENRRRSSSTMRGRRASSLIDSGVSNGEELDSILSPSVSPINQSVAVPHNEVDTADFFKHISQDLPEPRRMKQLLTWCGARSLSEKSSEQSSEANALPAGMFGPQKTLKHTTTDSLCKLDRYRKIS